MKIKPMTPTERLKYLISRYNEMKSIREKEKVNPSPDHKGKMKVIKAREEAEQKAQAEKEAEERKEQQESD